MSESTAKQQIEVDELNAHIDSLVKLLDIARETWKVQNALINSQREYIVFLTTAKR